MGLRENKTESVEGKTNLALIGFMGVGKTSVGRGLSKKLRMDFIDTDLEIEKATGMSVTEIFKRYGEVRFRSEESLVVQKAAQRKNCVISTGGGAVLREENLRALRQSGYVVRLETRPEIIEKRIQRRPRPLLERGDTLQRINQLMIERERFYRSADLVVDNSDSSREAVVNKIAAWFVSQKSSRVKVDLGENSYEILIGENLLPAIGAFTAEKVGGRRCLLVSNPRIYSHYGKIVRESLLENRFAVKTHLVPEGEEYKSLDTASALYDAAVEAGLDRESAIIALGGGVIGDLAGYAAATFLRGVPFIQVPTTLLAQVDSSVGGKVAVNHPKGKNLIGAFHQPRLVLCDPMTFQTLEPREMRSGMAEAIKYGVIWDEDLFNWLDENMEKALQFDNEVLKRLITRCCEIKAEIVAEDEREHGLRSLLNFGHTMGHALEGVTGYSAYRHGEAVAVGMLAAGRVSLETGRWSDEEQQRLRGLIAKAGLPQNAPGLDDRQILLWLERDKKAQSGKVRWVLPTGIGRAELVSEAPQEIVKRILADMAG